MAAKDEKPKEEKKEGAKAYDTTNAYTENAAKMLRKELDGVIEDLTGLLESLAKAKEEKKK